MTWAVMTEFILFVCLLHKFLFLEIKGLIIVWETVAFLFMKGHGSCWEVRDRGAARALRWTSQMPPIDTCRNISSCHTHSASPTFILSVSWTPACFLFNKTKEDEWMEGRREENNAKSLSGFASGAAGMHFLPLAPWALCSVVVYSYISKQGQIYTRPMPKGPLENLSEWITFSSKINKY